MGTGANINVDGGCVCGALHYSVTVSSRDDARTSLCHCWSCKRAFGTEFGLTTKVRGYHKIPHSWLAAAAGLTELIANAVERTDPSAELQVQCGSTEIVQGD